MIVDANAVLALAIPRQGFQAVAGECRKIPNRRSSLQTVELQARRSFEPGESLDPLPGGEVPGPLVPIVENHSRLYCQKLPVTSSVTAQGDVGQRWLTAVVACAPGFCEIFLLSLMPFHFEHKPALVAYVTCGDPDLATTREVILAAIDAGASVIELGVPFSDPLADGPVIQRASERALKHGTSLQHVLTLAAEIREHSQSVGLVIFSYLNPILRMGLPKFCQVARLAGIDGTLITDLPVEESAEYLREARKNDLATIFLAAPTSTDQRLKLIGRFRRGLFMRSPAPASPARARR